jgi:hypothetical protein
MSSGTLIPMISNFGGRVALRNRRLAHARLLLEDLSLARNETLVGTATSLEVVYEMATSRPVSI